MLERLLKDSDDSKTRTRPPLPVSADSEATDRKPKAETNSSLTQAKEAYSRQESESELFEGLDRSRLLPEASFQPEARSGAGGDARQQSAEEALAALRELAEEAKRQKSGTGPSKEQSSPADLGLAESLERDLEARRAPSVAGQDDIFDELRELAGKAGRGSIPEQEGPEEEDESPEIDRLAAASALDRLLELNEPAKGPRRADSSAEFEETEPEVQAGDAELTGQDDEFSVFQRLMETSEESGAEQQPLPSLDELEGSLSALEESDESTLADEAERLARTDPNSSPVGTEPPAEDPDSADSLATEPVEKQGEADLEEQIVSAPDKVLSFPEGAKTLRKKEKKERAASDVPGSGVSGSDAEPSAVAAAGMMPDFEDPDAVSAMLEGLPGEPLGELFPMEPAATDSASAMSEKESGGSVAVEHSDSASKERPRDELIETGSPVRYPAVLLPVSLDADAAAGLAALDSFPKSWPAPALLFTPLESDIAGFEMCCRQPGLLLLSQAVEGQGAPLLGPLDVLLAGLPDLPAGPPEGEYSRTAQGDSRLRMETSLPAGLMITADKLPPPAESCLTTHDFIETVFRVDDLESDPSASRSRKGWDDGKLAFLVQSPHGLLVNFGDLRIPDGSAPCEGLWSSEMLGHETGEFELPEHGLSGLPAWLIEASSKGRGGLEVKTGTATQPAMPRGLLPESIETSSPGRSGLMAREVLGPQGSRPEAVRPFQAEGVGRSRDIYEPAFEMRRPLERDLSDFV